MRRILTEAEIAQDIAHNEHFEECMQMLSKARNGKDLLKRIESIQPLKGNVIESNTTRRLPKGYLRQYGWLIRCLVTLEWSIEEMRELIEKISSRRITHQLVLVYVTNLRSEGRHNDTTDLLKTNRLTNCAEKRRIKEKQAEASIEIAQRILSETTAEEESNKQLKSSIWDYTAEFPNNLRISISKDKKGFVTIELSNAVGATLKRSIVERVVQELEPKLTQDPDGVKLLEHLKNDEVFRRTLKLTDASIYLLYVMTRQTITKAGWATSKDMDKYFEDIEAMPHSMMQWAILESLKEEGVSIGSIVRNSI